MAKDSRHSPHPVCRAVAKSHTKVAATADARLWSMSDTEIADRRAVGDKVGATDTASWWSVEQL